MSTEKEDQTAQISAEAAAARLGTTPLKILMLLKQKKLEGECREGSWWITESSLQSYHPDEAVGATTSCRTGCSGSCGCH
ncbi:DNA-binding protein [Geomonas sp. RF6]|uniref:DNA-binding protein n=1 Tax=Geomonas sp. RF6 TaxID=2897342 RepID=UPI001E2ED506|nr:DNA-binding protein [Geomonas sp. RF6]UFS69919.1 DNA-binding protein [Geomonas sp. RF6]